MREADSGALIVLADGAELSTAGGAALSGRESVGLSPCCWQLDLTEPGTEVLTLLRCSGRLTVLTGTRAVLASGHIDEVTATADNGRETVRVLFSEISPLLDARVSLTVPAGTSLAEAFRLVLSAAGRGILPGHTPSDTPVLSRPAVFHGSAVKAVGTLARSMSAIPALTGGVLDLIPLSASGAAAPILLTDGDLRRAPMPAGPPGGTPAGVILHLDPTGVPIGRRVSVSWQGSRWDGLLVSRAVYAAPGSFSSREELLIDTTIFRRE